jgi:uncharacterized membrane protein
VAGAAAVASVAAGGWGLTRGWIGAGWMGCGVAVAGVTGSLVDSALGELVQERRWCSGCMSRTEARIHRCGTVTEHAGGLRGVDNDVVNLACTVAGCLASVPFVRLAAGAR